MRCHQCGTEAKEGDARCEQCGASFSAPPFTDAAKTLPDKTMPDAISPEVMAELQAMMDAEAKKNEDEKKGEGDFSTETAEVPVSVDED